MYRDKINRFKFHIRKFPYLSILFLLPDSQSQRQKSQDISGTTLLRRVKIDILTA